MNIPPRYFEKSTLLTPWAWTIVSGGALNKVGLAATAAGTPVIMNPADKALSAFQFIAGTIQNISATAMTFTVILGDAVSGQHRNYCTVAITVPGNDQVDFILPHIDQMVYLSMSGTQLWVMKQLDIYDLIEDMNAQERINASTGCTATVGATTTNNGFDANDEYSYTTANGATGSAQLTLSPTLDASSWFYTDIASEVDTTVAMNGLSYSIRGEVSFFALVDFFTPQMITMSTVNTSGSAQTVTATSYEVLPEHSSVWMPDVTTTVDPAPTVVNAAYTTTTVTVTNASQQFLAATAREYLSIQNNHASATIYIQVDGTASSTAGVALAAGSMWVPAVPPAGTINIIGSVASNPSVVIIEGV